MYITVVRILLTNTKLFVYGWLKKPSFNQISSLQQSTVIFTRIAIQVHTYTLNMTINK